jgi:protein-tyrosine phosphatase
MQKKITWKSGQAYLFVCFGNTCRSPMAEGLARELLKGQLHVESAGISDQFSSAQPEAVEVMQEEFGIDISGHVTQEVSEELLRRFDGVIVLDPHVFNIIKSQFPHQAERLYLWDIDDPYGRPRKAYEQTAKLIVCCIEKFMQKEADRKENQA